VEEAKAIVTELKRIVQDPSMAGRSIGIVTFNSIQQKLIQDMVDDAVLFDPRLEQALLHVPEPLFIKNLENVQGDERDVILFSVGYGKDGEGKLYLNFGPLNRDGGWRRLNVAVSRARHEMVVFSTLQPEDIDLGRTASEGVAGLRAFLEYAQKGRNLLPRPIPKKDTSEVMTIEREIASRLQDRGLRLHTRVGCSDFRIDIAMLHPKHPETYLLAVLCDGEDFAATREVSDRHLGRRRVLEQLGWRVHQVWTIDWWEDPAGTLDRIEQAYRAALLAKENQPEPVLKKDIEPPVPVPSAPPVVEEVASEPEEKQESETVHLEHPEEVHYEGQRDYIVSMLEQLPQNGTEEIMALNNRVILRNQFRKILDTEAPVTRSLALQRVCYAWNIPRRGLRLDRHLNTILDELNFTVTLQGGEEVLWLPSQDPEALDIFRTPADERGRRSPDELPVHEVAVAVRSVVKGSFSLPEEELIRELTRLFGFARTGTQLEASMRSGISMARVLGWVRLADGRYSR
jgi:very-short-patch-repair endonuclease